MAAKIAVTQLAGELAAGALASLPPAEWRRLGDLAAKCASGHLSTEAFTTAALTALERPLDAAERDAAARLGMTG